MVTPLMLPVWSFVVWLESRMLPSSLTNTNVAKLVVKVITKIANNIKMSAHDSHYSLNKT